MSTQPALIRFTDCKRQGEFAYVNRGIRRIDRTSFRCHQRQKVLQDTATAKTFNGKEKREQETFYVYSLQKTSTCEFLADGYGVSNNTLLICNYLVCSLLVSSTRELMPSKFGFDIKHKNVSI